MAMKKAYILGIAGLLALGVTPAKAVMQIDVNNWDGQFSCADQWACDTNPAVGTLQFTAIVGNVEISAWTTIKTYEGEPNLNFSVYNLTDSIQTTIITFGGSDFFDTEKDNWITIPNQDQNVLVTNGGNFTFNYPGEQMRLVQGYGNWDGFTFSTTDALAVATPEPSTWAMLMLGAGLLGMMSRRRRLAA
jgi:hypothetical protein